jgi:hypothetical protein
VAQGKWVNGIEQAHEAELLAEALGDERQLGWALAWLMNQKWMAW